MVRATPIPVRYPTIHEVARACGVAASTVSRAFSSPTRVNAVTRERILTAAQQMGYRPNPAARALPSGRSLTLGLLVADITNPFFFDIIRGAEKAADAAGYTLVLADTAEDAETEARHLSRLARSVDGFLLASSRMSDARIRQASERAPLVLINRHMRDVAGVAIDTHDGMRQAVEHLAALGHRQIAFLSGPMTSWSNRRRWTGLTAAARRLELQVVRLGPYAPTLDGGHASAHDLARSGCSAAIAFNDLMAIGALLSLQERGIDVPGQMSIIGSDNIDGSTYCRPALTTLHSLGDAVGRQAVSTLIEVISGRAGSPVTMLPSELIVRSSTGPISARARASMPAGAIPPVAVATTSPVSVISTVSALSG
jgi:LacI family transcriptional regulator, repressor for deo operon, udp, cdd, tsx, nupC, and nupG